MKIGVITYSQSNENYGQLLQCYAMQQFLKKLGHSPFLIQYLPEVGKEARFKFKNFIRYVLHFKTYVLFFVSQMSRRKRRKKANIINSKIDRHFADFRLSHFELTSLYNKSTILQNPPQADAFICGSDQIWGNDDAFYLNFVRGGSLKIAYAPSFGGVKSFPLEKERRIRSLIQDFAYIGVREQSGVDLCHRLGRMDAEKVIDPTLLLDKEDYDKIKVSTNNKNFIFVYLLGNPTACSVESIYEYAKQVNIDVIYVSSQGRMDQFPKKYATIGEWLGYLSESNLVITNSFHCVAFSLVYHKPFVALPLNQGYERMNGRIEELLSNVNLSDRIWDGSIEKICSQTELNFFSFDAYKKAEVEKSKERLLTHIRI